MGGTMYNVVAWNRIKAKFDKTFRHSHIEISALFVGSFARVSIVRKTAGAVSNLNVIKMVPHPTDRPIRA